MTSLSVDADLTVERGEETFSVVGDGRHVVVDAPSLAAAARFRTAASRATGRTLLSRARDAELTLDVRVRGRRIARLAPEATPGVVSSLLGVTPMRVSVGGVALAAVRALRS